MINNSKFSLKDLVEFIFSKVFVKQIGLIFVFYIAVALILLLWLRFYTNHGQKLELPDYRNKPLRNLNWMPERKNFNCLLMILFK